VQGELHGGRRAAGDARFLYDNECLWFMNTTRTQPNCVSTRPRRRAQLVGAHRASCEPSCGCPWHCYSAPSRRVLHRRSKRGRAAHAVTSPLTRARTTPASSLLASGAERSHTRVAVGLSLCPGPRNTVGARPCVVGRTRRLSARRPVALATAVRPLSQAEKLCPVCATRLTCWCRRTDIKVGCEGAYDQRPPQYPGWVRITVLPVVVFPAVCCSSAAASL
jgi:hypothetical protein